MTRLVPTYRGLDRGVKCDAVCGMEGGIQHDDHEDRFVCCACVCMHVCVCVCVCVCVEFITA